MKNFLSITAALLLSTAASAQERWEIDTHGGWLVELVEVTSGYYCSTRAEYETHEGFASFTVTVNSRGIYSLYVSSDIWEPATGRTTVHVLIDFIDYSEKTYTTWTLEDANLHYVGEGIWMTSFILGPDPQQRDIIADFMRHDEVHVVDFDGESIFGFSLTGSTAAIRTLDECRARIMAEPT